VVLKYADVIGATSRLLEEVKTNPAKKFIVATEYGIFHQMQKARPDALLLQAPANHCACNECPYMKMNSLEKIAVALETLEPQVRLSPNLIEKARTSLTRMMAITRGERVEWPAAFSV
jgi:quinolinate synthase